MTEEEDLKVNDSTENCEQDPVVEALDQGNGYDSKNSTETVKVGAEISISEVQETFDENETKEKKEMDHPVEDKSLLSTWSFSHWSENFESVEDEKPIEDFNGDPEKLILWASEKNELETLRSLLEDNPSLVNTKDNDLYTPLHRASYSNNSDVIKILLSHDADVGAKTEDEWEPLHCACKWDSVEAASLLLQNGANVNATTKGNITPLHLAASNSAGRRTLELLLWHPHIDPTIKNNAGDTAYEIACRTGPLGTLFEILEESVNVY